jgi:DNA-binding GntR family transcriptional regulator
MAQVHVDEVVQEAVVTEEPPTVREQVRRWLLAELLHGRVPLPTEDEPLSENWLAKESGVESRMPARMALAVLAGEGLILQRARHGFWMVEYNLDDIAQIVGMRADVEARVVEALFAESSPRNPDVWGEVVRVSKELEQLFKAGGTPADLADLDAQFHVGLALTGDLQVAARHIDEWSNQIRLFELQNRLENVPGQETIDRHRELIAAIASGDPREAMDLIRRDVTSLGPTAEEPDQADEVAMTGYGFVPRSMGQSVSERAG